MTRRVAGGAVAVACCLLVTVALAGCGSRGLSRDEARDNWVETIVHRYGVLEEQAACVVDAFFAELDDDELRPLTKGEEMSPTQSARFEALALGCGIGPPTSG
jgi:hypothetical protein